VGRRQKQKIDLGNAISIEDALSIMIVTFVLFVIFLVPLVTVEKNKLEKAQTDDYWTSLATWIEKKGNEDTNINSYSTAFELDGARISKYNRDGLVFIEALFNDGSITVIRHNKKLKTYVAMYIKGNSKVVSYRFGNIKWSKDEKIWFSYNDSIDYGNNKVCTNMQKEFRKFTKDKRGF